MNAPPPAAERRITILQGEHHVARDPRVVLTTILGSCVAACIFDPAARIGGMNHFLLPGCDRDFSDIGPQAMRYGVYAMELLVNALLGEGAQRHRLRARLFGGARMLDRMRDIGDLNASFAERFLRDEGIPVISGSLRGNRSRRLEFWPASGRVRQLQARRAEAMFAAIPEAPPLPGNVEIF